MTTEGVFAKRPDLRFGQCRNRVSGPPEKADGSISPMDGVDNQIVEPTPLKYRFAPSPFTAPPRR